jgi:hypothetical protein
MRLSRPLVVILGLILALASAVATNLAFLFKHRGAVVAPPIRPRQPLRSAVGLFRSRWFLVGWIVAIVAWGLHVGALALAPLSIVQAVLSGGLVFLAVFAERFFGFQLGRRQWVGVTITAMIAGVIAFYASARSLQIGNGVEVIALTSVAANLTAIIGGIIVFHDPIGSGPPEIGARFLAFCLVIAGAALMPAPMRATPDAG